MSPGAEAVIKYSVKKTSDLWILKFELSNLTAHDSL
jgi:hypothetical protein